MFVSIASRFCFPVNWGFAESNFSSAIFLSTGLSVVVPVPAACRVFGVGGAGGSTMFPASTRCHTSIDSKSNLMIYCRVIVVFTSNISKCGRATRTTYYSLFSTPNEMNLILKGSCLRKTTTSLYLRCDHKDIHDFGREKSLVLRSIVKQAWKARSLSSHDDVHRKIPYAPKRVSKSIGNMKSPWASFGSGTRINHGQANNSALTHGHCQSSVTTHTGESGPNRLL